MNLHSWLFSLIAVLASAAGAQQSAADPEIAPYLNATPAFSRAVAPSTHFDGPLQAQAVGTYSITLQQGQAVTIRLLQQTGEIGAISIDPQKRASAIRINDSGKGAALRFTLIASETGSYEIRVRCLSTSKDCQLAMNSSELRQATASDSRLMSAEEAVAGGDKLAKSAATESRAAAARAFDQALSTAGDLHDDWLSHHILYLKARLALRSQQYAQARDLMLQATRMAEPADDIPASAVCWKVLGYSYAYLGELDHALLAYAQARTLYVKSADAMNEEILDENSARAHRAMGENDLALDELTHVLEEARLIHDERGLVASLEELGNIHQSRGDLQEALDAYRQAMESPNIAKVPVTQAHVLNGLGHVYTQFGEYDRAQSAFDQSVALWRQIKDTMGEAYALDGEAFLAYSQGNYPRAIEKQQTALDLVNGTDLARERSSILEELGESFEAAGRKDDAVSTLSKALTLAHEHHLEIIETNCLRSLGEIALSNRSMEDAAKYFSQAHDLNARTVDKQGQAMLLADEARLARMQGQLEEARKDIDAAVTVIESSRISILNADSRSSYFDTQHDYYDFSISLLMEMDRRQPGRGYAALAFDVSERARARSLLDTLHENGVGAERGVDPALIARERDLSNEIEGRFQQLTEADDKDASPIRAKLLSLQEDYDRIETEIRAKGMGYGAMARGKTISASDLSHLLDPDTVLLEYWIGKKESYLWAITSSSISTYPLGSMADLPQKTASFYAELTARNHVVPGESAEGRLSRIHMAEASLQQDGAALAQQCLQPAAGELRRHKIVAVVAEGPLQSMPLQPLPFDGKPLIETHEVVYLPSASLLSELRRREGHARAPLLAVFADPVFSRSDPRVVSTAHEDPPSLQASGEVKDLNDVAGDLGFEGFPRLPYSRGEAESIGSLVPAQDRKISLDFDASRAGVLDTDWSPYTIVHFSTHALVDDVHPELSGIVLSLVDRSGAQVNGFLRMSDIYKINIPADLVVLSACRTGLGKNTRGEGVIGLSRAFTYAGTRGVIATLWNVNDRATATLMQNFYKGLLEEKLSPAAALAQAQRVLAHDKSTQSPYFWAPFVLIGDPAQSLAAGATQPEAF